MESNHHSTRRQDYSLLSSPLLSVRVRRGGRPGSNRRRRGSQPRVLPSTPRPPRSGEDRTRTRRARRARPPSRKARAARLRRAAKRCEGKAGTTGLEPAASRLTSECSARLSYAPDRAGGIRTHGLELMRLARTAAPLPRRSGWRESNLRSPAPEAGGVASSPTARWMVVQYPRRDSNPQLPG